MHKHHLESERRLDSGHNGDVAHSSGIYWSFSEKQRLYLRILQVRTGLDNISDETFNIKQATDQQASTSIMCVIMFVHWCFSFYW